MTSYVDSFAFEWNRHRTTQLDSVSGLNHAEKMFFSRTGFTPEELKGATVLDAGCGIGRFSEIAAKYGAKVTGLDLSNSVDVAAMNVPQAQFIQGDILNPPFDAQSFDLVFSMGVLHHTPSAVSAFLSLAELVKPGGKLAVWVYPNDTLGRKIHNLVTGLYRIVTTRMESRTLYRICEYASALYHIYRIPVIGKALRKILPISMEADHQWRILDTFDWYSPKYQSKHTGAEVEEWFWAAGFTDIKQLEFPTNVVGTKL